MPTIACVQRTYYPVDKPRDQNLVFKGAGLSTSLSFHFGWYKLVDASFYFYRIGPVVLIYKNVGGTPSRNKRTSIFVGAPALGAV